LILSLKTEMFIYMYLNKENVLFINDFYLFCFTPNHSQSSMTT